MTIELAAGAAIGCAICNALATILQKISSDRVTALQSYDMGVIFRLLRQLPYVVGIGLDLLAGAFILIAVSRLPLFIVQAIIASGVVLTAFLEQLFLKRKLSRQVYLAAAVVLIGLGSLAAASHSEPTTIVSNTVKDSIIGAPVFLLAIGAVAMKMRGKLTTGILAGLSGVSFGGVSIIGRLLIYPSPLWKIVENPLLWALAMYGALGLFFFTAALQRTLATIVNGVMTAAQTLIPLLIGIVLLGDTARNGLWALVWAGCLLVVGGCVYIASTN